jgi:small-conductance mechanosensitive channel
MDITSRTITKEAYLASTNIESIDQARSYLNKLRVLFISNFILSAIAEMDLGNFSAIVAIIELVLLIYFIFFCAKVLKAEKEARINAAFCILLAPLSWFWFYPRITNPLKIIIGKKQPPASLPLVLSEEELKLKKTESRKKFWKNILIASGISLVILFIFIYLLAR